MIAPIRFLSKEEIEELDKKLKTLGFEGLVNQFIEKGWSKESAEILAETMLA